MVSEHAQAFFRSDLDAEGQEFFLKILRQQDINPYLYEILVLVLGFTGLHWLYLKQYRLAATHAALAFTASAGLGWGLLSVNHVMWVAASMAMLVVFGVWTYSWFKIKEDVTQYRESNESKLIKKITALSTP